MSCGIYAIYFPNGKSYIGQSKNILKRFKQHKRYPENDQLKNCFIKYKDQEELVVVEECSKEDLTVREQFYLDLLWETGNLINVARYANKPPGMVGRKHTDETLKQMSKTAKGRKLSPEHRAAVSHGLRGNTNKRGAKLDAVQRKRISDSKKGPMWDIADEIRNLRAQGLSYSKIKKTLNISCSTGVLIRICKA